MGKYWIITIRMLYLKMLQLFWHHNKCLISGLICKNECYWFSREHMPVLQQIQVQYGLGLFIFFTSIKMNVNEI